MPQERCGAESEGAPQSALGWVLWACWRMGHIFEPQQQHWEAEKKVEASMAEGVASNVARSTRARTRRDIGGIVASLACAIPS